MKLIVWLLFFFTFNLYAEVSKSDFSLVVSIAHRNFKHLSLQNDRKLKFYTNYQSDWAQAFARRWDDDEIHLYGGFAKISKANVDSLALIICHELGHLYAGAPYSNQDLKLSVEGMSDYWATRECMPKMIEELPEIEMRNDLKERCEQDLTCTRILQASLIVTTHFAKNSKEKAPSLDDKDLSIVEKILKTHPSAQCRLDTFYAGYFQEERPRCWMKEE